MATPVKRIEKEFLLKVLFDEQIPVLYNKGLSQYKLTVTKPPNEEMFFKTDYTIKDLQAGKKIDLMFNFKGHIISFPVVITSVNDKVITAKEPEALYKNLDRTFSRVQAPPDLQVKFLFTSDRYSLSFPRLDEYEAEDEEEIIQSIDPRNLSSLIKQMEILIKSFASGYRIVIFKDYKPANTEEQVIAATGKSLFLASTTGTLPVEDPFPKKRLITEDAFKKYLETSRGNSDFIDEIYTRFIKQKKGHGILSDLWVPIIFQEYVIGYIRAWIDKPGMPLLGYDAIENLYQFSKILSYSLKINRYFDSGKIKNDPFDGKIIDISASGLLFSYPISKITDALMPETELTVELIAKNRTVNNKARIVRTFKDKIREYYGCIFIDMQPEDLRFLFEHIYGKTFTDKDAAFLSGQV